MRALPTARIGVTSGPLLATIAIGFDILTILLPATAGALWLAGQYRDTMIAWAIYAVALTMTLIAASSFVATNVVTQLRQARAAAELRDKLDAQIAAAEAEKAKPPAIASADPGAEWLATTLHAGFGLPLTPAIIGNMRIAGLAMAPPLSGWLLKFAFVLLGMRRR